VSADDVDLLNMSVSVHDSVVIDTTVWKTENGRKIALVDMEEGHLRNTIRFIQRKQAEDALLDVRGDHVMIVRIWQHIRAAWETAMLAEAARRGLVIE
jgi:hypothetical protein